MKKYLKKLDLLLEKAFNFFNCLLIAGVVGVITFEVFSRYLFSKSHGWSDELLRFALIWMTFMSLMNVARENKHLRMEMFFNKMPFKVQVVMEVVGTLLSIAMCVLFCVVGMKYCNRFADSMSPMLGVSYRIVYICMPIGFATLAYQLVMDLVKYVKNTASKEK